MALLITLTVERTRRSPTCLQRSSLSPSGLPAMGGGRERGERRWRRKREGEGVSRWCLDEEGGGDGVLGGAVRGGGDGNDDGWRERDEAKKKRRGGVTKKRGG